MVVSGPLKCRASTGCGFIERFQAVLSRQKLGLGLDLGTSSTQTVPIIVGETSLAIQISDMMLDEGIFVTGFGYPVVPQGHARIRCQVSAVHTREDLEFAVETFKKVGRKVGLLK